VLALAVVAMTFAASGPVAAQVPQAVAEGEELYMEILGCWNCHGRVETGGAGGEGEPLQGTYLPLSLFVKELRLPARTMPPFSPLLATDAELATVYAWLEGMDPVRVPPPVELRLAGTSAVDEGQELELALTIAPGSGEGAFAEPPRLRLTVFRHDNGLVADLAIRRSDGAELSTDAYGQVVWRGTWDGSEGARDRVASSRTTLTFGLEPGRYVVVVEAIQEVAGAPDPAVLGIASSVVEVGSGGAGGGE
jgi:mono/diheme cytochrome c family protein